MLSLEMSAAFDPSIFQRRTVSFALSQRFKHNWHEFKGTIKVAFQTFFFNSLLKALPPPPNLLVRLLFSAYLLLLIIVGVLLVWRQLTKRDRLIEDIDLFSIARTRTTARFSEFEYGIMLIIVFSLFFFIIIMFKRSQD